MKVNVTTQPNLAQEEYDNVGSLEADKYGDITIRTPDGIIMSSYEKGEWTAFAVEVEE